MKEYLLERDGEYKLHKGGIVPDGAIEVPEGAEIAIKFKNNPNEHGIIFYKNNGKSAWSEKYPKWDHDSEWNNVDLLNEDFMDGDIDLSHYVLWSRLTKPEESPFVDDEPQSLNEQYAEIEKVRQTLSERAAQYGSFVGVANTTGQLMAVILNSPNGHTLPYAHQEALHMIASKIARIVNGDYNHKDSWHDIQGYAKLIEDLIG